MAATTSKPLSTWEILWKGIKLPTRNWGLMLPILLLSILYSSLLPHLNYLTTKLVAPDATATILSLPALGFQDPAFQNPAVILFATKIIIIEIVFAVVSFFFFSLLSIATVTAAALICIMNHITLKQLLSRVITSWKGPTTTKLFITVLFSGWVLLLTPILIVVVMVMASVVMMASRSSAVFIALALGLALAPTLVYVFLRLGAVWALGFVVSVVEDGCQGAGAIARAGELIKGRRRQGIMIITFLMMTAAIFGGVSLCLNGYVPRGKVAALAKDFVAVIAFALWGMVFWTTTTVFYYDCREIYGGEMVFISEKIGYTKMAAEDTDLP